MGQNNINKIFDIRDKLANMDVQLSLISDSRMPLYIITTPAKLIYDIFELFEENLGVVCAEARESEESNYLVLRGIGWYATVYFDDTSVDDVESIADKINEKLLELDNNIADSTLDTVINAWHRLVCEFKCSNPSLYIENQQLCLSVMVENTEEEIQRAKNIFFDIYGVTDWEINKSYDSTEMNAHANGVTLTIII